MRARSRFATLAVLVALALAAVGVAGAQPGPPAQTGTPAQSGAAASVAGRFVVIHSHPEDVYFVVDDQDPRRRTRVLADEPVTAAAGGLQQLKNRRVIVTGPVDPPQRPQDPPVVRAQSIQLAPGQGAQSGATAAGAPAVGATKWVTLLCAFADMPAYTSTGALAPGIHAPSWYQTLLTNTATAAASEINPTPAPGVIDYHRDASYRVLDLAGSDTFGWFTLPRPLSYYRDAAGNFLYGPAWDDCTAAAVAQGAVQGFAGFAGYYGANLVFTGEWGTAAGCRCQYAANDGARTVLQGNTWYSLSYSKYQAVWGHEMGHGYGLPHSGSKIQGEYNNDWDVMGYPYMGGGSPYTYYGVHTIAYHKDLLGWLGAGVYIHAGGTRTIQLEQLGKELPATPSATGPFHMARVPIPGGGGRFYTVEVRRRVGDHEGRLCYTGATPVVIIHEVDPARNAPAYVVDPDNNGRTCDAGAMWTARESFSDRRAGITIDIGNATTTGVSVTIRTR